MLIIQYLIVMSIIQGIIYYQHNKNKYRKGRKKMSNVFTKKITKRTVFCLAMIAIFLIQIRLQAQLASGYRNFLGNIYYKGQTPANFDRYWNQVTPENAGKWASCEQARDDMNYWLWLDRAYEYAKTNGFVFKEHCLVWGHSSGQPGWVCNLSASEQRAEVEEWIQALGERYPDMDLIDVVNEPLHAPPVTKMR
jgi:endo-1,4-beta-xylanase